MIQRNIFNIYTSHLYCKTICNLTKTIVAVVHLHHHLRTFPSSFLTLTINLRRKFKRLHVYLIDLPDLTDTCYALKSEDLLCLVLFLFLFQEKEVIEIEIFLFTKCIWFWVFYAIGVFQFNREWIIS